mmetsp:Transcript_2630/g.4118  ORF Transcript_2630/g.4118 Transcript_2630/m.4118 type:complete len:459 (+) Transcript_2630:61-1437(+)|eukprot:15341215-Ditylum_brightwellii.AAC.1
MGVTFLLASARFVGNIARLSLGPLLPLLSLELGFPTESKPALLSAYSSGYILTQIAGGFFADRYGAPFVLAFTSGASAFVLLALASAPGEWGVTWWIRLYAALGLLAGPLFPASSVAVKEGVEPERRAGAAAVVDAAASAGTCVATLAPAVAAATFGWRGVFIMTAVAALFVTIGSIRLGNAPRQKQFKTKSSRRLSVTSTENGASAESPYKILFSIPSLSLYLCNSCDNFCKYILNAWLATMFVERYKVSAAEAGGWLAIVEAVGVVSRVLAGMRDPLGEKFRWVASSVTFLLQGAFLFLAFNAPNPKSCALFLTLYAFCTGGHSVGFRPRYFETAPHLAGLLSGYGNTIASMASAMGPVAIGMLLGPEKGEDTELDNEDERWNRVAWLMLAVGGGLGLIGALGLGGGKKSNKTPTESKREALSGSRRMSYYELSVSVLADEDFLKEIGDLDSDKED